MNERTPFQVLADEVVTEILRRHRIHCSFLPYGYLEGAPSFCASYSWKGQENRIELYGTSIVMFAGKGLFEVYMPAEFKSDRAYVEGFGERLDRYLSGGDWAGPDESGALERRLRNLWSRWKRCRRRLSSKGISKPVPVDTREKIEKSIAFKQGDLEGINDALHDHWLDVDGIEQRAGSVRVPISRLPSQRARQEDFSRTLVIEPVKKLTIVDTEGIGFYDVDFLELLVEQRVLVLRCNTPIDIHIELKALPVHLQLEEG